MEIGYGVLLIITAMELWIILRHRVRIYTLNDEGDFVPIGYSYWSINPEGAYLKVTKNIGQRARLGMLYFEFYKRPVDLSFDGKILVNTYKGIIDIKYADYMEVNLHFIR